MAQEVVTVTLAEAAAAEDAATEALVDEGFVPGAPLTEPPPAYAAGTTYAKNALVTEGAQVYRSQVAGNKGNKPNEDADFVNWAPVSVDVVPLQKSDYNRTPTTMLQQAHNNKPPARSDAAAAPAETIGVGAETPV